MKTKLLVIVEHTHAQDPAGNVMLAIENAGIRAKVEDETHEADPVLPDHSAPQPLKTWGNIYGVSSRTIRRWINNGTLDGHKIGKMWCIKPSDL